MVSPNRPHTEYYLRKSSTTGVSLLFSVVVSSGCVLFTVLSRGGISTRQSHTSSSTILQYISITVNSDPPIAIHWCGCSCNTHIHLGPSWTVKSPGSPSTHYSMASEQVYELRSSFPKVNSALCAPRREPGDKDRTLLHGWMVRTVYRYGWINTLLQTSFFCQR